MWQALYWTLFTCHKISLLWSMDDVLGYCFITLSLHVQESPPSSPHFQSPLAAVKPISDSQLIQATVAIQSQILLVFTEFWSHQGKHWFGVLVNVIRFVVIQLWSHARLFAAPQTASCQASLSFTISQSLLKFMSIESVMPSNHLILCLPLLLLPSIFPSIKVFSNESALCIRWPKHWSFSFNISSSSESWFPLGLIGLISWLSKGLSRVFLHYTQALQEIWLQVSHSG